MSRRATVRMRRRAALAAASGPLPNIFAYADTSPLTAPGGVVSNWAGFSQASAPARPTLEYDSVSGLPFIRFDTGLTLAMATGAADVMHKSDCTVLLVARQRIYVANADQVPIDSSGGGATPGWQLRLLDAPGLGHNRQVRPRVSNGSTWVIDHGIAGPFCSYASLKWSIIGTQTSATRGLVTVDHSYAYDDAFSVTLPTGSGGALTLGNMPLDVMAFEVWTPALSDDARDARIDYLANRFGVDVPSLVAGDSRNPALWTKSTCWPSMGRMSNGNLLYTYRIGADHASTDGAIYYKISTTNGAGWSNQATLVPYTGFPGSRDCNVAILANNDVIVSWFRDDDLTSQYVRSSDNGATWTSPTRVTHGYTQYEITSSPWVQNSGRTFWAFYVQNTGQARSSARLYYSDDNGATWPGDLLLADGVADGRDYTEPGLLAVTVAQPGLNVNDLFILIRDDGGAMYECKSTDNGVTHTPLVNTGMNAHSAARIVQLADGTILYLGRPNALLAPTIYKRVSSGVWNEVPGAVQIDAYNGTMIYGTMLDNGGGDILVAYTTQIGNFPNDFATCLFRHWSEDQIYGRIKLVVSPSSLSTTVGTQTTFTARGAGNYVWSLHTNATGGSINASTGVYTAGSNNGTDVVRCVSLNGETVDTSVVVTGAVWSPASAAHAYSWASVGKLVGLSNGNPIPALAEQVPGGAITSYAKVPAGGVAATYVASATPGGKPAAQFTASTTTATPNGAAKDLSAFTKGLWFVTFKTSVLNALMVLYGQASAGYEWSFEGDGSGKLRGLIANATTGKAVSNASVVDGNWHYAILRWDGTTVTLEIDGADQATTGTAGSVPFLNDAISIGAEANGSAIDATTVPTALITDVGIWSDWTAGELTNLRAFLAAQIA